MPIRGQERHGNKACIGPIGVERAADKIVDIAMTYQYLMGSESRDYGKLEALSIEAPGSNAKVCYMEVAL
jgi:hypothetical protein